MPLIEVKVIEGVFTSEQKKEIVKKLTDAMVSIEGENMRHVTMCTCVDRRCESPGSGKGKKLMKAEGYGAKDRTCQVMKPAWKVSVINRSLNGK